MAVCLDKSHISYLVKFWFRKDMDLTAMSDHRIFKSTVCRKEDDENI